MMISVTVKSTPLTFTRDQVEQERVCHSLGTKASTMRLQPVKVLKLQAHLNLFSLFLPLFPFRLFLLFSFII
jgi:hypothetical protein